MITKPDVRAAALELVNDTLGLPFAQDRDVADVEAALNDLLARYTLWLAEEVQAIYPKQRLICLGDCPTCWLESQAKERREGR